MGAPGYVSGTQRPLCETVFNDNKQGNKLLITNRYMYSNFSQCMIVTVIQDNSIPCFFSSFDGLRGYLGTS